MADEIGEALQRVASASENSNISLEKSASWLATISSVTRESASTIGRSLNSIISRYESIKENGFNEEDSSNINDVTKALSRRAGTKALPPLSNEAIASLGRACVWGVGGLNEVG